MKKLIPLCALLMLCSACAPYKPAANEQVRKLKDDETGSHLVTNGQTQQLSPEAAAELVNGAGKTIPRPGG